MIYVNQVFCEIMNKRSLRKTPRNRYSIYQKDLHRISQDELTDSTLLEGDQYSYTELGDSVLNKMENSIFLSDVDLSIFAYWTPEFDPDHSAFGPYFMDQYNLKGYSFDICDNGSLVSTTALGIADNYLSSDSASKILLLGMEQNTIPRNISNGFPIPERSCAIAALLTTEKSNENKWILLKTGQVSEWELADGLDAFGMVRNILHQLQLDEEDTVLLTERTGYFFKKIRFQIEAKDRKNSIKFAFLKPEVTGMNILLLLADKTLTPLNRRNILLVEHDMESLRIAWSVLQKI
ncbi:hypothetical protein [Photorhabdus luminescens]|uniref:Beta-ketoacyl synthase N-terminal domain-containing protein n=1 Tax=Photorhabdus luminescens subsp. mexicana TaxID=2100167 RepID=A0A4R4JP49_PHOLU|nr:hypothetical protein [Photorhabdus luminescens]TDB55762.1 hypothetical protein C5468_03875 [Photorhabdus luminescens subsp. mexicana]